MKRQTRIELFGLAATALACLTQPAFAAPEIVTKSIVVRFADLNLANAEGAQTLYQRIQKAARQVCGWESTDTRVLAPVDTYSKCYRKAVDDAVNHVNQPMLTARHRQETGAKGSGEERVAQGNPR